LYLPNGDRAIETGKQLHNMPDRDATSATGTVVRRPWLPAVTAILLCLLVVLLWWVLDNQRNSSLHRLIDSGANEFSSYIESDIRARIPALQ
jgi:sensor domain CHASE-containing protein